MSRQFKNRKAVDPYGKDYSTIPDTIQWGDMMISKDASPDIWEKYAAKIKAGEESPKGYRERPPTPLVSTRIQPQPLRSVPAGTIREPLFGRNPDGSPKPRPKEMDAAEVLALAQEQERKYNPPQKATKKTASSTSAKPASTPPGVIGYDALNQPVYGRTAPTKKATPDFLNAPKPSAFIETPKQPPNSSSPGYGSRIGQPAGTFNTMDFIDRNRDGTDDRYQAGPNKPSEGASNLNPNGFPVNAGYKAPPEYYAKSGEGWTKDAFDKMNAVNKYRADLAQQEAMRKSGGVKVGVDEYGNPKYAMSAGRVFSGSYDNNGDPIYGVPVPGMKVNLPKGSPLPKDQVLAMRQEAIEAEKQRQADWSTGGRPTKEALLAKQGITGNNQALAVWDGSYDSNGDPRYGIPVPGMKVNVPKGQPLNREQAKAQKAEVSKWASTQNKQRTDTPASTIAPYRDMQGYPVKLDDMYISGGLGKSAESKKQSDEAKRKASQPASTKGTGQTGGSFRVINGQVRFFGSGADTASEVEAVKPTGMR